MESDVMGTRKPLHSLRLLGHTRTPRRGRFPRGIHSGKYTVRSAWCILVQERLRRQRNRLSRRLRLRLQPAPLQTLEALARLKSRLNTRLKQSSIVYRLSSIRSSVVRSLSSKGCLRGKKSDIYT